MKKEITIEDLNFNPFVEIKNSWCLISSKNDDGIGIMTASWGSVGTIWGQDSFTVYIRPTRQTYEFVKKNENFTISFFTEEEKNILKYCGVKSGRDVNKLKECNLSVKDIDSHHIFNEARLSFTCKKVYMQQMDLDLLVNEKDKVMKYYEGNPDGVHILFIGFIVKIYE